MAALRGSSKSIVGWLALVLLLAGCMPPADGSATLRTEAATTTQPASTLPAPGLPTSGPQLPPAASGSPLPITDVASIAGTWWPRDGDALRQLSLSADGRYRLAEGTYPGATIAQGSFTFGDGVLTWQEGWFGCSSDQMGSYELWLTADGEQLWFLPVGEECPDRAAALAAWPVWQRWPPPS